MEKITIKERVKRTDGVMTIVALCFKEKLKFGLSIDKDFYDKPTEELLKIADPYTLYATVMEDKYWLQIWSDLLFQILVDELYD